MNDFDYKNTWCMASVKNHDKLRLHGFNHEPLNPHIRYYYIDEDYEIYSVYELPENILKGYTEIVLVNNDFSKVTKYKENKEYCFSLNEEEFDSDIDYILDQLEEENYYEDYTIKDEERFIYMGECDKKYHKDYIDVEYFLELMANRAYDDSELAESYLENIPLEDKEGLQKVILDYMDKNIPQPNFYLVNNIRKITVSQFKKDFC